ncbi:hypothetical protein ABT341_00090 [Pseudonocardia alni]|uniref:hypothetical protein n=1 Tax=Pseudonocardia alni TaxID=33907 RepID=UPI00332815A6
MTDDSNVSSIRAGRRAERFVQTPEWILVAGLTPQAQALYTALLAHVNRKQADGIAWPGMAVLAQMLGYRKRQSISPYLNELGLLGAIQVVKVPCPSGQRNEYVVHEIPPPGYTGFANLAEFYADRRKQADSRRMSARADIAASAVADMARSAAADKNHRKRPTRIDPDEDASSVDAPAGASPAACLPHRASSPGDRRIVLPKGFYTDAYSDKRARQYLVGAALKAIEAAGYDPADTAGHVIGSAIKHKFKDWPRRELVRIVRDAVRHAGDPHHIDGQLARGCEYIAREAS